MNISILWLVMDEEQHIKELENLCRVCGGPVKQNRLCKDHQAALESVFSIDITADKSNVHPKKFCKRCYAVISRSSKAEAEGRIYLHAVEPAERCVHVGEDCMVCGNISSKQKGGRPPKGRKRRGRSSSDDMHTILTEAQKLAPPSFFPEKQDRPSQFTSTAIGLQSADVQCPICQELLDQPLQLQCGSVVCNTCIQR